MWRKTELTQDEDESGRWVWNSCMNGYVDAAKHTEFCRELADANGITYAEAEERLLAALERPPLDISEADTKLTIAYLRAHREP
jgi:hypothetical protein